MERNHAFVRARPQAKPLKSFILYILNSIQFPNYNPYKIKTSFLTKVENRTRGSKNVEQTSPGSNIWEKIAITKTISEIFILELKCAKLQKKKN